MTFWHYHWALIRARELDLSTFDTFVFAHMAQLTNPAGVVAYSITSMAADIGCERKRFSEAVRRIWETPSVSSKGRSKHPGKARIYCMVMEQEARVVVEAWRAEQRALAAAIRSVPKIRRNVETWASQAQVRASQAHTTKTTIMIHERDARFSDPPELTAEQKEATRQRRAHALRRGR